MGLSDIIGRWLRGGEKLASAPREAVDVAAARLAVSTAEEMVVVVIDTRTLNALQATLARGQAAAIYGDGTTAYFVPVHRPELPVRDPKAGWAIPVDEAVRGGIVKLGGTPQAVEISDQLGLVIEEPPRP